MSLEFYQKMSKKPFKTLEEFFLHQYTALEDEFSSLLVAYNELKSQQVFDLKKQRKLVKVCVENLNIRLFSKYRADEATSLYSKTAEELKTIKSHTDEEIWDFLNCIYQAKYSIYPNLVTVQIIEAVDTFKFYPDKDKLECIEFYIINIDDSYTVVENCNQALRETWVNYEFYDEIKLNILEEFRSLVNDRIEELEKGE